jgi:pimeloyl-ACP methyl ester carboxylesterase
MRRGWKILIGVGVALIVLIGVNIFVTDAETKSAEVTEPGGRIVSLAGGDLQVTDSGPRNAPPIVLIHCFTCAMDWWDQVLPRLEKRHRVVRVDLLGHGGSEMPASGYSIEAQADLVAEALAGLGVRNATVVGHSLGGTVSVALAERSPRLAERIVIVDSEATHEEGDLGLLARLTFVPVVGPTLWRVKPDFSVREGLQVAFAPGFDVPDAFVEDLERMTYSAYDQAASESQAYSEEKGLGERVGETGKPLLVIMGAEEQIIDDPAAALAAYRAAVPGAKTKLMPDVGHSPNVEAPAATAALILAFTDEKTPGKRAKLRQRVQDRMQKREAVRKQP